MVLVGPVGEVADVLDEDARGHPVALVEEDRAGHRLEGVGEQGGQLARPGLGRALAEQQRLAEVEALAEAGQRHRVDQRRAQLGELALVVGGEAPEQVLADDQLEHGVAEVLETLVVVARTARLAALVVPRGVGHRLAEQLETPEADPEPLLQGVEAGDLLVAEAGERVAGCCAGAPGPASARRRARQRRRGRGGRRGRGAGARRSPPPSPGCTPRPGPPSRSSPRPRRRSASCTPPRTP